MMVEFLTLSQLSQYFSPHRLIRLKNEKVILVYVVKSGYYHLLCHIFQLTLTTQRIILVCFCSKSGSDDTVEDVLADLKLTFVDLMGIL